MSMQSGSGPVGGFGRRGLNSRGKKRRPKIDYDDRLRRYMLKVYNYVFLGLLVTAVTAWFSNQFLSTTPAFTEWFFSLHLQWIIFGCVMLALFFVGDAYRRMSVLSLHLFYWGYTVLFGILMSWIFWVFTTESMLRVFLITASMFGGLSMYGYLTRRNVAGWEGFLFMMVIGLIALAFFNSFFWKSNLVSYIFSTLVLLVFMGLTIADTQIIKEEFMENAEDDIDMAERTAVFGALMLYIDFKNIFIALLRLTKYGDILDGEGDITDILD